ncbi:efflux transporter outer membrane subunit [Gluconobacter cerinus]|uniref:efflux transporter outer membrane subunit n=1 Tax=Gluconobacter cerinus TaxID=38307 RepID=UPI001B8BB10E|nr:efflux transporter outer membrane subunit [Gluconobacter cerinus]MBS1071560.1 efflux transporter outer membrane subunit [Gluconobacter cerinus]
MKARLGFAALLMLSGCNMAPRYYQPTQAVQNAYPQDTGAKNVSSVAKSYNLGWEDFFTDPRLKALVQLGLRNNRDLAAQAAAITVARGQYEIQNASLFPIITAGGQGMFMAPSSTAGFSFAPGLGTSVSTLRLYQTSIGFSSYEVDLWGRIRNLTKQQAETVLNSVEGARNVLITTVSQIGTTYIQWLADREQLRVTRDTLKSQRDTLRLTQLSYDNGETDALTLAQVKTQVEQASAYEAQYLRAVADDEHGLQVLVGVPLPADLPPPAPFGAQTMISDLPEGLPSDLLAQRPDIVAAEHTLIGANASIGAARAEFFPKVTLTASEGTSSLQFRKLFTPGAETWSVSPSISLPIFTWGQSEGNLLMAKGQKLQYAAQYEKTVQTAFREVSDALTARETYTAQQQHMQSLVDQSQKAYDLAKMRYDAGIDSYLTTLEQQRTLYQAQQNAILVQAARFQNLVTLYRALGGGWSQKTVSPTVPAATH